MAFGIPFLVRFGEDAREVPPGPSLHVGPDGLLRRDHTAAPFIDELRKSELGEYEANILTIMTKATGDPPDPDTIRFERFGIETVVTRAESEHIDPDTIRANAIWALTTSFTNGGRDKPDPDWIRRN